MYMFIFITYFFKTNLLLIKLMVYKVWERNLTLFCPLPTASAPSFKVNRSSIRRGFRLANRATTSRSVEKVSAGSKETWIQRACWQGKQPPAQNDCSVYFSQIVVATLASFILSPHSNCFFVSTHLDHRFQLKLLMLLVSYFESSLKWFHFGCLIFMVFFFSSCLFFWK